MKIDTTQILTNYRGEGLKDQDQKPLTIGHVIEVACLAQFQSDTALDFQGKARLNKLAGRCVLPFAEFTTKEAAEIMERIGKAWPPVVCGPVEEIFDPPVGVRPNGADASPLAGMQ